MYEYRVTHEGFTFKRVDKRTARTAYVHGLTVIACPVNLMPFTSWHPERVMNRADREEFTCDDEGVKNDFNNLIASFEWYNCHGWEAGRYAAFYIPFKTVDTFTGEKPGADTIHTVEAYDYTFMLTR